MHGWKETAVDERHDPHHRYHRGGALYETKAGRQCVAFESEPGCVALWFLDNDEVEDVPADSEGQLPSLGYYPVLVECGGDQGRCSYCG
jgi:hypothetical protein